MPLPDRPVANATIETDWGQGVHDRVFAAWGSRVSGGAITATETAAQLPIDTAVDDPGGWADLSGNRLVVPTDRAGLYLVIANIQTVDGTVESETRGAIYVNGSSIASAVEQNEGGVNVVFPVVTFAVLTAGDVITVYGQLRHDAGTNPSVLIASLAVVFLADELGA